MNEWSKQRDVLPTPYKLVEFWETMKDWIPSLASAAVVAIWMPETSIGVEKSFFQYLYLLALIIPQLLVFPQKNSFCESLLIIFNKMGK